MDIFQILGEWLSPYLECLPTVAKRPAANEWCVVDGLTGVDCSRFPRLHIPAITHVAYLPKAQQPVDLGVQKLTTSDGEAVIVNATAKLCIWGPIACYRECGEDWEELCSITLRGQVQEFVTGHTYDEVLECSSDPGCSVFVSHDVLDRYGIDIIEAQVEDLQHVRAFSLTQ